METPKRTSTIFRPPSMDEIPVYNSPHVEKNRFLIIYKSKESADPGIRYSPYIMSMRKPGEESTGPYLDCPIAKDEVDMILKKVKRKKEDIKCFICNLDETDEERLIKEIENWFFNEFPN